MSQSEIPPQVFVSADRPTAARLDPIENGPELKPTGGLWTSSYRDPDDRPATSAWIDWMTRQQWWNCGDDARAWLLHPTADADVYVIDSLADLQALAAEFEWTDDPIGGLSIRTSLDYEAVAEVYDGIWLTSDGQRATRFSTPSLYGWDCETILWFDWCFEQVEALDIPVRRDRDTV